MMKVCFDYRTADGREAVNFYGLVWEEEKGFTKIPLAFLAAYQKKMKWPFVRAMIAVIFAGGVPQTFVILTFGTLSVLAAFLCLATVMVLGGYVLVRLLVLRHWATVTLVGEWLEKEGELGAS